MRRTTLFILGIALVASACSSDSTDTTDPTVPTTFGGTGTTIGSGFTGIAERFDPDGIQFVAALERFDACEDVLEHFKSEALARVGPYGLDQNGSVFPVAFQEEFADFDVAAADDGATAAPAAGGDRAEGSFSGTNTQVAGVDEPDIVKTDGDRIVAIVNGRLQVVDIDDAELIDSISLDGWDHRLFLNGDKAIVFSRGDVYATPLDTDPNSRIVPAYGGPVTLIHEIDLSGGDLEIISTLRIEGSYLSARSIDGTVRVVVSAFPSSLPFVYPSSPFAEDLAERTNRQVIMESTLETWLPSFTLTDGDGDITDEGLVVACDQVHRPVEFAGFDSLAVMTFDSGSRLAAGDATAVIARGETVYSSTENLFVATNVWVPSEFFGSNDREFEERYETAVHQFDISGGTAEYLASGSVSGHLLNQFAMDEYDGRLRIATTDGAPWSFSEDAESRITVLQPRDGKLVEVGSVGDMGRGERIFSVRFIEETAYVVTFRQVDPLYVVDLSDPENPEVAGELKIAGYSAYLHPLGNGRILGVGQDATEEGFTTGAKVTLFDVSDPSDPIAVSSWTRDGSYTDVEWDHLAFLYWPVTEVAVLPLQSWSDSFFGAVVLKTDDGVREVGRVSHSAVESTGVTDCEIVSATDFGLPEEEIDPDITVMLCGEDDRGGLPAHECEVFPAEMLAEVAEELPEGADFSSVGETDRFEVCFPTYNDHSPILRSLVVGDQLWTLSWQSLQANDLDSLDVLAQVPLS